MKRISLLLIALLMLAFSSLAQIKMIVHLNDAESIELYASSVDSITFTNIPADTDDEDPTDKEDDPIKPDDDPVYDGSFVAKPFSVGENKTVTFSPGNLQYHAANNEWRFAPNQTDYIGEENANISSTYNGWIDLFGWGTGNNPTNNSTYNSDYQTFVDWGVNKIGNYAPNTWRTLTKDEWYYLRYERPNYYKLIGVAQVNGVNGLILLPDDWTCPSGVTFKSGFHDYKGTDYYAEYQTFSASDWSKLEASGAVFFPAAGCRGGSDVNDVQYVGYYWSATKSGYHYADDPLFRSDEADMYYGDRYDGHSVRLVQDNNNKTDDEDVEDVVSVPTGYHNTYGYVDLGLPSGTLWATMNVGADSPEDYGDYFAWGETEPKDYYYWDSYKWMTDGAFSWFAVNKYTFDDGQTSAVWYDEYGNFIGDNKTVLELADDAANANWGGDWRMPTKAEQDELRNTSYTTWAWTTQNGINGYKVTSKSNGNSIFLPAAGHRFVSDLLDAGSYGVYWSSSLSAYYSEFACSLYFNSDDINWHGIYRCDGKSVRPVLRVE